MPLESTRIVPYFELLVLSTAEPVLDTGEPVAESGLLDGTPAAAEVVGELLAQAASANVKTAALTNALGSRRMGSPSGRWLPLELRPGRRRGSLYAPDAGAPRRGSPSDGLRYFDRDGSRGGSAARGRGRSARRNSAH